MVPFWATLYVCSRQKNARVAYNTVNKYTNTGLQDKLLTIVHHHFNCNSESCRHVVQNSAAKKNNSAGKPALT